jgi:hypothetical protein
LERNFFWIGKAIIGREKVLVKFRGGIEVRRTKSSLS